MAIMSDTPLPAAPGAPAPAPVYGGLVSRTIAFALDVAIVDAAALVVGAVVALALSPFSLPDAVETILLALAAGLALLWWVAYFAGFWSVAGQTPGDRALGLRVEDASTGATLGWPRALLRLGALVLAVIPLCAGLVPILFDARRRGLHDRLAGTVVIVVDESSGSDATPARLRRGST